MRKQAVVVHINQSIDRIHDLNFSTILAVLRPIGDAEPGDAERGQGPRKPEQDRVGQVGRDAAAARAGRDEVGGRDRGAGLEEEADAEGEGAGGAGAKAKTAGVEAQVVTDGARAEEEGGGAAEDEVGV